jgi:hypothetical protein
VWGLWTGEAYTSDTQCSLELRNKSNEITYHFMYLQIETFFFL